MKIKELGLGALGLMIISLAVMINTGISAEGMGLTMLVLFSLSIAFTSLFYEDWFNKRSKD